jgi:uncharacterized membrane protein YciS (DUF1049 family)
MDMAISAGNIITIVSVLLGVGIGWGALQQQIKEHAKLLAEHEAQLHTTDVCLLEIKIKLAEIARDILHIRERMEKDER